MKIAIMQPYFFPYLGYFSLMKHTDKFILLDTVQFIKRGWIDRNKILKPSCGNQYFRVPLIKHGRDTKIKDVKINNNSDWRTKILLQLEHYKKRAPYYKQTIEIVERSLDIDTESIVKLNENIMKVICESLDIELNLKIFSEMNLEIQNPKEPDEWAINICKSLGKVQEYWNPEGGIDFFNTSKYEEEGIRIKFLKINLQTYSQRRLEFEKGLSIIDVMMFNGKNEINNMLDEYEFL